MKINKSGKIAGIICLGIFAFILLCNVMTLKVADDYAYCYSWADWSRITKVMDIIPSMAAHAKTMNGRLVSHSFAQFFLMFPDWVFDIVNSLVFVAQVALAARIAKGKDERSNLTLVGIFCAMWFFGQDFGQANLWLDGACNYLWNVAFGLMFIWPFVKEFLYDELTYKKFCAVPFALLSFLAGGYGEAGSAAFIFMAGALVVLSRFWLRKKFQPMLLVGLIAAVLGYISIYLSPAELTKGGGFDLYLMYLLLRASVGMLLRVWALPVAFVGLLALNIYNGAEQKRIVLALVFFLGAMCANFILIFATGYSPRVAVNMTSLLITADAILLHGILGKGKYRTIAAWALVLLIVVTPIRMTTGVKDIYQTYQVMKNNEAYLTYCAETGIKGVELPIVYPETMYSAAWNLRYLSTTDPNTWPNNSMNRYFGVDSVLGVE